MADILVEKTQQWLNETYHGKQGYGEDIVVDGITGWGTVHALLRAFQIELGITATSTSFGPSTTSKFKARFPNGVQQQSSDDTTEDNIYGIIQGACFCKGYSIGSNDITNHFYSGTGSAITSIKKDAGCSDTSSTVTLNIMKSLLSMDQFKLVRGGNSNIREIQQKLNNKYENYIGLTPCDGIYSREMNKSLIAVLQKIEGFTGSNIDGKFGNGTKSRLPIVPSNGSLNSETEQDAIELVRYALVCNGYPIDIGINSNKWDSFLGSTIGRFQKDMILEQTNICDTNTWMALLVSTGNQDRPYNAIDTSYTIHSEIRKINRIDIVKNLGVSIVGRYISGNQGKELAFDEAKGMIDNGIKFYPIYQRDGEPSISYFTESQGWKDVQEAYSRARSYCIPKGTIIYFVVDIDMLDNQIEKYALPYFKAIDGGSTYYKAGVYGTRNVCSRVMDKGYATTCFVSNSSSGYSGNMGFKMPTNWNLDQFQTDVKINDNFTIDKNIFSNKFPVVTELSPRDYYYGTVLLESGRNVGRRLTYAGRKLNLSIQASGENGEKYDDMIVDVWFKSPQPFEDGICTEGHVVANVDSKIYNLSSTQNSDSIFINDNIEYYISYDVFRTTDTGYVRVTDKKIKITTTVNAYYL